MGSRTISDIWGLVLAAGDGAQPEALTGELHAARAPTQFCSLFGGQSLLEDALDRAAGLIDEARVCTIVAHRHREWWCDIDRLARLAPGNVIVQPHDRGAAIGVLYGLLHILAKDPDARVLLLPADQCVSDEDALREALERAIAHVRADAEHPVLVGLEPDDVDTELGYIVPGAREAFGARCVARLVAKPDRTAAADLIAAGGLWNSLIVAASARSLLDLFLPRYSQVVAEMQITLSRGFVSGSATASWPAIVNMYARLPLLDFSRDLLEGREQRLRVIAAQPCGWSDLATPRRVAEAIERMTAARPPSARPAEAARLDLAARASRQFVR